MFYIYRRVSILWLFFFLLFPSSAQEGEEARMYHAGGSDFVLAVGGHRTVYRPDSLENGGFSLHDGDILQTGRGGFVEIRLIRRGVVIRMAESTSLSYHAGENGVSLGLSYGRILLAESDGELPGGPVSVRPGTAEVVFRGGTVGIDYTIQPGTANSPREPALRVYALSGSADLIPRAGNSSPDRRPAGGAVFPLHGIEMVSLETMDSFSYVERKSPDQEIIHYWDRQRPAEMPPLSLESPSVGAPAVDGSPSSRSGRGPFIPPDYEPFFRTNTIKNVLLAAGISLSLIGAGLQGFARYGNLDNPALHDTLTYTGYGVFGMGVLTLGTALFINPKLPVPDGAD
jgi:hypothetical protein